MIYLKHWFFLSMFYYFFLYFNHSYKQIFFIFIKDIKITLLYYYKAFKLKNEYIKKFNNIKYKILI